MRTSRHKTTTSSATGGRPKARRLGPGRPTKEDIVESNEHLLEAAQREFLRKGFRAASINGIAKASRISRVAIYRRYGNKEALFAAVCERSVLNLRANLRNFTSNSRDPALALEQIALHIYDDFCQPQRRDVARLMIGEMHNFPEIAETIYRQTFLTFQPLADFFRQLHEEGVLHIEDPALSALQFSASLHGSLRPLILSPKTLAADRERWIRNAVRTFLYGCLPRDRN